MAALFRFLITFTVAFFVWNQVPTPIDAYLPQAAVGYISAALLLLSFVLLIPLLPRTRRGYEQLAIAILVIGLIATLIAQPWSRFFR